MQRRPEKGKLCCQTWICGEELEVFSELPLAPQTKCSYCGGGPRGWPREPGWGGQPGSFSRLMGLTGLPAMGLSTGLRRQVVITASQLGSEVRPRSHSPGMAETQQHLLLLALLQGLRYSPLLLLLLPVGRSGGKFSVKRISWKGKSKGEEAVSCFGWPPQSVACFFFP